MDTDLPIHELHAPSVLESHSRRTGRCSLVMLLASARHLGPVGGHRGGSAGSSHRQRSSLSQKVGRRGLHVNFDVSKAPHKFIDVTHHAEACRSACSETATRYSRPIAFALHHPVDVPVAPDARLVRLEWPRDASSQHEASRCPPERLKRTTGPWRERSTTRKLGSIDIVICLAFITE